MNRNAMTLPGLMRMGLLALALGASTQPPDYEAIRQRRLARVRADLIAEGLTEDEATAELERIDREAIEMAGSTDGTWSWCLDLALRDRRRRRLLSRGDDAIGGATAALQSIREGRFYQMAAEMPDYELRRQERLHRLRSELQVQGMTDGEAAAKVAQIDRAARSIVGITGHDWGSAFDNVVDAVGVDLGRLPDQSMATAAEIAAAAGPPGSTMLEVNRRRREAGELGTKRQRTARKGRR